MSKKVDREPIDVSATTRAPVLDVPTAVALGIRLLGMVPKQAPPSVKTAARALRQAMLSLQTDWGHCSASRACGIAPRDDRWTRSFTP